MVSKSSASPAQLPLRPIACCVLLAFCEAASANPTGAKVTAGAATFQEVGKTLNVTNAPGHDHQLAGLLDRRGRAHAVHPAIRGERGAEPRGRRRMRRASSARSPRTDASSSSIRTASCSARARVSTPRASSRRRSTSPTRISSQGRLKFEGGGNGVLRNEGTITRERRHHARRPDDRERGQLISSDHGSVLLAAGQESHDHEPRRAGRALRAPGADRQRAQRRHDRRGELRVRCSRARCVTPATSGRRGATRRRRRTRSRSSRRRKRSSTKARR